MATALASDSPATDSQASWRRQAWFTAAMALTFAAGFSFQLAMGRSSFDAPAIVHAHALIFFGWVVLALVQSGLAATGRLDIHRRLGWVALPWILAMLATGTAVTFNAVRSGRAPFFFQPQAFIIEDVALLACFLLLTIAALALRRAPGWHRRLHFAALACLLGPAFGRLLPMPLLMPWSFEIASLAGLVFPLGLALVEWRADGRLHPAWLVGIPALPVTLALALALVHSPAGDAIHAAAVAGSPAASRPGLAYPPPPGA